MTIHEKGQAALTPHTQPRTPYTIPAAPHVSPKATATDSHPATSLQYCPCLSQPPVPPELAASRTTNSSGKKNPNSNVKLGPVAASWATSPQIPKVGERLANWSFPTPSGSWPKRKGAPDAADAYETQTKDDNEGTPTVTDTASVRRKSLGKMWKNGTKTAKKTKRGKKEGNTGKGEDEKTKGGGDTASGGEKQSQWESVMNKPNEGSEESAENESGMMKIDDSDSAKEMTNEEKESESEEGVAGEEQGERTNVDAVDVDEEEKEKERDIIERESAKESSDSSEKIYKESEETTQSEGDNLDENIAKKPKEETDDVEREQINKPVINAQYRGVSEDEFYESVIAFPKETTEDKEADISSNHHDKEENRNGETSEITEDEVVEEYMEVANLDEEKNEKEELEKADKECDEATHERIPDEEKEEESKSSENNTVIVKVEENKSDESQKNEEAPMGRMIQTGGQEGEEEAEEESNVVVKEGEEEIDEEKETSKKKKAVRLNAARPSFS
ncbi:cilia- and flagella-associated protein 251-like [Penaeus chinensis]|uniref:cilia- and flagella-associated protein 251-like n=1 Tax=Penaeus chinensis TaxID=139456 RepID=UPI001FB78B44|nr:cilia- and flagella-associated protein 251-like [Penaeus chinensis]